VTYDWPQMMKRKTAAAYCDVSEGAFEGEILHGRLPSSVILGGRGHWYKPALDAALARIAGEPVEPEHVTRFRERHNDPKDPPRRRTKGEGR
jgi:hypothetical protein